MDEEEDEAADDDEKIEHARNGGDDGIGGSVSEIHRIASDGNQDEKRRRDGFDGALTVVDAEEKEAVEADQ